MKIKAELIKVCLAGRCQFEDNWLLSVFQRWFFTIKAILCILLGLEYTSEYSIWLSDSIIVGIYNFKLFYNYEYGEDASFVNITVAREWNN